MQAGVPLGVVLAAAGCGNGAEFRAASTGRGREYAGGVSSTTRVWPAGQGPPPPPGRGRGRPPRRLRRDAVPQPVTVKERALEHRARSRRVTGRDGPKGVLSGRVLALRVRSAHRDDTRATVRAAEWLLLEWPAGEPAPTQYALSTLPEATWLKR